MGTHISLLDMMDMIRVDGPLFRQVTAITLGSASVFLKHTQNSTNHTRISFQLKELKKKNLINCVLRFFCNETAVFLLSTLFESELITIS
jgi:hypothetical protein